MRSRSEAPKGECTLRREIIPPQGIDELYIDHADSRVLIADEVMADWQRGAQVPELTLDGDLVKIRARNRTVIYRLVEHVPEWRAWIAEWPD